MNAGGLFLLVFLVGCAPLPPHPVVSPIRGVLVRGDGTRLLSICPADGGAVPAGCVEAPMRAEIPHAWPLFQPRGHEPPVCYVCEEGP